MKKTFVLGLDLGQAGDFTALVIIEKTLERAPKYGPQYEPIWDEEYHVRHLERLPLNTPYPEIVSRVATIMSTSQLQERCTLVVDATGPGRPVVDLFRKARLNPQSVTITAGLDELFDQQVAYWRVPKRILASNLKVLFDQGAIKFADKLPMKEIVINELLNFSVKITPAGNDTYEALREGIHDDLVLAIALAGWWAARFVNLTKPDDPFRKKRLEHPLQRLKII